MNINKLRFNLFGEFADSEIENQFLQNEWENKKNHYFISYNACCILLLIAGLLSDFRRPFLWGSAYQLIGLRVILVLMGLLAFPLFWKNKKYERKIDHYGFFVMLFSSIIVLLLNLMTGGKSSTMLAGILIITVCYYMVVPSILWQAIIAASIQLISFFFFYDYSAKGIGTHIYMCFMLVAINFVMILFKKSNNKNQRINYLFTDHLKETNEMKTKLMALVGHDLRNPLTIINMRAFSIKKNLKKGELEKALEGIESLENTNNRLAEMLQSLQDWAQSEKTEAYFEKVDVSSCLEKVIPICEEVASHKNITINKEVESKEFLLDVNMMESIIRNLVNNAIKFSPENSSITISGRVENDFYLIKVSDQGDGMEAEKVTKILSGEKVESTKGTNGENGTGLGLQLVMNFLKLHQAKCEIISEKGEGSQFVLSFPI